MFLFRVSTDNRNRNYNHKHINNAKRYTFFSSLRIIFLSLRSLHVCRLSVVVDVPLYQSIAIDDGSYQKWALMLIV